APQNGDPYGTPDGGGGGLNPVTFLVLLAVLGGVAAVFGPRLLERAKGLPGGEKVAEAAARAKAPVQARAPEDPNRPDPNGPAPRMGPWRTDPTTPPPTPSPDGGPPEGQIRRVPPKNPSPAPSGPDGDAPRTRPVPPSGDTTGPHRPPRRPPPRPTGGPSAPLTPEEAEYFGVPENPPPAGTPRPRTRKNPLSTPPSRPREKAKAGGEKAAPPGSRNPAPQGPLTPEERQTLRELPQALRERMIGQDHACDALAVAVQGQRVGFGGDRPVSVMFAGTTGVGKCIAWDTPMVDPETGEVLTAEEVYRRGVSGEAGADVLTLGADQKMRKTRASDYVDDGVKPVYRVRTALGREVRTTLVHPFLSPSGWTPLAALDVGDRVGVPRRLPVFGTRTMPEHEVSLLACLVADGGLTTGSVTYTKADPALLDEVERSAASMGQTMRRLDPDKHSYAVNAGHRGGKQNTLIELLRRTGLWGLHSHEKFVPAELFALDKPLVALFLNRLFAGDGSVYVTRSGGCVLEYATSSPRLARDVQHLALRFGVNLTLRRKRVMLGERRMRDCYRLYTASREDLDAFAREVGILGPKGRLLAEALATLEETRPNPNLDTVPREVWPVLDDARREAGRTAIGTAIRSGVMPRTVNRKACPSRSTVARLAEGLGSQALAEWAHSDIYWDRIVSIEYEGLEQVYDLTVPETHNFVAADVYVHNTETAKALADAMFGGEDKMIRLDMSEYQDKLQASRFVGAPPGYVGHDDVPPLVAKMIEDPRRVVLFDEIEKAHPDVLTYLLQILDDGRLTSSKGETLDFTQAVVVLTTNLGAEEIRRAFEAGAEGIPEREAKELLREKGMRPELVARIGEIVTFRPLLAEHVREIARLMLEKTRKKFESVNGATLELTDGAVAWIGERGYEPENGARPLRSVIVKHVEKPLSNAILRDEVSSGDAVTIDVADGGESLALRVGGGVPQGG
ncbi:MAG: AAA family ATPase, partial [Actinomycetota bacterium]|nr:AAA family ATPase [Actinomycetota bacterium]